MSDDDLRRADASWNSGIIGVCLMDMLKADRTLTLADMEARLRELDSKTFLVAMPGPPPQGLIILQANGEPTNHWLWICLHGRDEMREELRKLNRTEDQNRSALETTGFLAVVERRH